MSNSIKTIRIGTRKSLLAMAQSQGVADALQARHPELHIELVPIITSGDRYFGPLHTIGGKGVFTAELENALRDGSIDLAVHSAKDMPATLAEGLIIAAVPTREDARDALVLQASGPADSLPRGAVVGTSSPRRGTQMRIMRSDLQIVPIRGNVETRLRKIILEKQMDATVLAMAGLIRSGLLESHRAYVQAMDVENFVPAAGQGALAVQACSANAIAVSLAAELDDEVSHQALDAERQIVRELDADCHSSLAVHLRQDATGWEALLLASKVDGSQCYRHRVMAASAAAGAQEMTSKCLADGVSKLLKN